jgi:hypothetical protein
MKKIIFLCFAAIFIQLMLDCGPKVMVPPRIDLKQHEVLGIIDFSFSSEGDLGNIATKKFSEEMRRDQGMIRIVELGSETDVLADVGQDRFSQTSFKEIGRKHEINTVITGELIISNVRPNVAITPGLSYLSFSAEVDATLNVQMVETSTGASIWSSSASETQQIGNISIFGGKDFAFNADDPEKAYGKLVNNLVNEVTRDFRVTWRRK